MAHLHRSGAAACPVPTPTTDARSSAPPRAPRAGRDEHRRARGVAEGRGRSDLGEIGYGGPQPPEGEHRTGTCSTLLALDDAAQLAPGADRRQLRETRRARRRRWPRRARVLTAACHGVFALSPSTGRRSASLVDVELDLGRLLEGVSLTRVSWKATLVSSSTGDNLGCLLHGVRLGHLGISCGFASGSRTHHRSLLRRDVRLGNGVGHRRRTDDGRSSAQDASRPSPIIPTPRPRCSQLSASLNGRKLASLSRSITAPYSVRPR